MSNAFQTTSAVLEVDLADPLPELLPATCASHRFRSQIRLLLRLHTRPVGQLKLQLGSNGMNATELATEIWRVAGPQVRSHLRDDGLPVPGQLQASGLGNEVEPACLTTRRTLLKEAPSVTVLIATRDRTYSLARCLRSLSQLAYPRYNVLVVDNAPTTDETARAIEALQGRLGAAQIRYLREERPGLALAHNRGIKEATGEWLAITDDDVVVDPHWLTGLIEGASVAPEVACVTGLILPAEIETPAQELLEQYGGFSRGFTPRRYNLDRDRPLDPLFPFTTGRLGSGANMAFNTEFLRGCGGFDPATGAGTPARGGDDLFGFFRVLTAKRDLVYEPSAMLWHWHRRDYKSLRRLAHGYGVGLGAYLTSAVVHEPRLLWQLARSVVPGVRHFLSRSSSKNAFKQPDFPRALEVTELLGVMRGPFAYAISRWQYPTEVTR
jgi:glycosyltransferase involved in cell wall biosynthesis